MAELRFSKVDRCSIDSLSEQHLALIASEGVLQVDHPQAHIGENISHLIAEKLLAGTEYEIGPSFDRTQPTGWHTDGSADAVLNFHETRAGIAVVMLAVSNDSISNQYEIDIDPETSYLSMVRRAQRLARNGLISPDIKVGYSSRTSTLVWREQQRQNPFDMAHAVSQGRNPRFSTASEILLCDWPI